MKKVIWLLLGACLFCVTGCSNEKTDQSLSLSATEQEAYIKHIDALMDEFYWSYDKDSLTFRSGEVPLDSQENTRLFNASEDAGYSLKSVAGNQSVNAAAELLHYNGDIAGEVSCIFVNNHLSGVYYIGGYDDGAYSLRERNPFLANGKFTAYENWTGMGTQYRQLKGSLPESGFVAKSRRGIVASIQNGQVELYHLTGSVISRMRRVKPEGGLEAIFATFVERGEEDLLAVLLADVTEVDSQGEPIFQRSEKVVFYNSALQVEGEMPLKSEGCTALGFEDGKLFLFIDQAMETYELKEGSWERTRRESLRHRVMQCHITDLDGNGEMEYLMTDGLDLYLYQHLETGLLKLWSTHLGVESLYGALYSGDLNGDGVKEVYICDATGTAIRYILTERGLRSSNEDIQYGQAIYPCDWNNDGIDDYWNVTEEVGRTGSLYLSQP
ncbi:FG-GAP repeat domain-containing protein [Anaerotignum sp. MB30-C6]|uniref:FG-GAP repeat domain-containing protein n=1 Tax=Anaerotignum sp. MB30-C6 TaxID=3070814 RepID=UPI0027DAE69C|nr:VCBS repeat-containing protein [Anaerotignum sp. MB30-C6]WMI81226.1 VCBS repeat-containing protein [Anaerotignum sp. MB30-C6]